MQSDKSIEERIAIELMKLSNETQLKIIAKILEAHFTAKQEKSIALPIARAEIV
jgi:hypothetical protein